MATSKKTEQLGIPDDKPHNPEEHPQIQDAENAETGVAIQQEQPKRMLITQKQMEISKEISSILIEVGQMNEEMNPFEKMIMQATAFKRLSEIMTDEFIDPLMFLQGNGIGFRTDRDKENPKGYSKEVVRNCFIEATMNGFSMKGNQVNILASKPYYTKEGFTAKLRVIPDLVFPTFVHQLPVEDKGQWSVTTKMDWTYRGVKGTQTLTNPVKKNSGMEGDGLIGKAERKCLKWLHNKITGLELSDGEVDITESEEISSHPLNTYQNHSDENPETATEKQQKEFDKAISNRDKVKTLEDLQKKAKSFCATEKITSKMLDLTLYNERLEELTPAPKD